MSNKHQKFLKTITIKSGAVISHVEHSRGGHLKLTVAGITAPIFTSSTPSDNRAALNIAAFIKRRLENRNES